MRYFVYYVKVMMSSLSWAWWNFTTWETSNHFFFLFSVGFACENMIKTYQVKNSIFWQNPLIFNNLIGILFRLFHIFISFVLSFLFCYYICKKKVQKFSFLFYYSVYSDINFQPFTTNVLRYVVSALVNSILSFNVDLGLYFSKTVLA